MQRKEEQRVKLHFTKRLIATSSIGGGHAVLWGSRGGTVTKVGARESLRKGVTFELDLDV